MSPPLDMKSSRYTQGAKKSTVAIPGYYCKEINTGNKQRQKGVHYPLASYPQQGPIKGSLNFTTWFLLSQFPPTEKMHSLLCRVRIKF